MGFCYGWTNEEKAYKSYVQLLQKIDNKIPHIHIYRPKDILIYADCYGIEPCADVDKLKKRIVEAIKLESPKKTLEDIISPKLQDFLTYTVKKYGMDKEKLLLPFACIRVYFNEDNKPKEGFFRAFTTFNQQGTELVSYPELIGMCIGTEKIDVKEYTSKKFNRLNYWLINPENIDK